MSGREGESHERGEQREAEIDDALQKLNFLEGQGVDVQVDRAGRIGGFIPGANPTEESADWEKVGIVYEDLLHMHKSERERSIILEAWERFQEERA